jgi:hypothetical protein
MMVPTMKTLLFRLLIVATALQIGCSKPERGPEREATYASAQRFNELLLAELKSSGPVEVVGPNGGETGNVYAWTYTYLLSPTDFMPERLYDTGKAVMTKWGDYDSFSARGTGSGRGSFRLHYGSHRTHAFVDAVAFPEGDKTRVDLMLRAIE